MHVQTVTGPVDTSQLGAVLTHEHIFTLDRAFAFAFPDWFDPEEGLTRFAANIEDLKQYGLGTFIDATAINLGRDINLIHRAAQMTGINIIACTGLYYQEAPGLIYGAEPDLLASYFIRDLTEGIQGTNIRAGIVKCSTDEAYGFSLPNHCMIMAAARAALATDVQVTTHAHAGARQGLKQQEILMKEGLPAHRIAIGHAFSSGDVDYIAELAKNGSYVGCDQIGYEDLIPSPRLAEMIAELCRKGYEDHILLSHDQATVSDFGLALTHLRRDFVNNAMVDDYHKVFTLMPGLLREAGVTEEQINKMLCENPRRYLEGVPF